MQTNSPHYTPDVIPSSIPALRTRSADPTPTEPSIHTSQIDGSFATTSVLASDSTSTSLPTSRYEDSTNGLSGGAKAAIGVFSVIGVLAITALLLLLFCRRHKGPRNSTPKPLIMPYGSYHEPHSGSRTPLIAPSPTASPRVPPLMPPAKLSDRKFLHPAFTLGTPEPHATSSNGDVASPSSPTYAPSAYSGYVSRHKRTATMSSLPSPITNTKAAVPPDYPQSSVYSLSLGLGTSTVTVGSNKASSVRSGTVTVAGTSTPPLSPTRIGQAHDDPLLESSDFVTPAGPPPNRALPRPPTNHPNSPTFSVSPVSPRSPTFPPRSLVRGDSPAVPLTQGGGSSTAPPVSTSTKELCQLTESYARETRESWGSWSGIGGGGPGVHPTGRKRGSGSPRACAEKKAVALQELDLEKLSGKYRGQKSFESKPGL